MLRTELQETFVIDDTYNYDNATSSDHHDIWTDGSNALTRQTDYSLLSEPSTTDVNIMAGVPSSCIIEADVNLNYVWSWTIEIVNGAGWSLGNAYSSAQANTWYHMKLEVDSTSGVLSLYDTNGTLLGSSTKTIGTTPAHFLFKTRDAASLIRFKNFRIYNR